MIELLLVQPTTPSVDEALDAMRDAYATDAIADRMTYETLRSDGTFDNVAAVIRIDNSETRTIRYDTSGFAFRAQGGVLTGAGLGPPEPRRVLVAERENSNAAEVLAEVVPTGPLPQLWTAEGPLVTDPALGVIRFTEATTELGTTTINGSTALGSVRVQIDADSGRLVSLQAVLRDGTVELRSGPIKPGEPDSWSIETSNRRIVSRIDQLAPNLAILEPGDTLPNVSLQHPDGTGITLADWHDTPPEGSQRAPWSVVVFADATSIDPSDALRAAAETLAEVRAESAERASEAAPAERFWLRFRPLIVLVLAEDTAFETEGTRPDLANADVLYSARPDLTIDRLPLAPLIAVGIDRNRVIGAMGAAASVTNNGAEAPLDVVRLVDQLAAPSRNRGE